MRIEKGHVTGNELNGTTTALNLGMGRMVSKAKDSIGSTQSERTGLNQPDAFKLVGLKPVNPEHKVPAGSHLMTKGTKVTASNDQGYVTSACYSPNLGYHIALGFLKSGDTRIGEVIRLVSPLTGVDHDVEVVSAHFVDPEGDRLRA
jgi:sarcosine oxidase subunit alpha